MLKACHSQLDVPSIRLTRCSFHTHRLQSKNGKQQVPLSTATVSMVHSVPELMVSSEVREAAAAGLFRGALEPGL